MLGVAMAPEVVTWLEAAKLVPRDSSQVDLLACPNFVNVLHRLVACWELVREAAARSEADQVDAVLMALKRWRKDGAELRPVADPPPPAASLLEPCLCWQSQSLPAGRKVAIVSSRMPRLADPQGAWIAALRSALSECSANDDVLLAAEETAAARFVIRGAARYGLRSVIIRCFDQPPSPGKLAEELVSESASRSAPSQQIWLLPEHDHTATGETDKPMPLRQVPRSDRAAFAFADTILALHVRRGGNIHTLLRARLTDSPGHGDSVRFADVPQLVAAALRKELLELGAVAWTPASRPSEHLRLFASLSDESKTERRETARIVPLPTADTGIFLTHTTRACPGPWPGQSEDDYLDSLIEGRPDADHSALATLKRIVVSRRLCASNRTIRAGYRVVSLTAVPLAELPKLRVFRTHLNRWDFEPYGISIRREWLEMRDTRLVQYGDDTLWRSLPQRDRPFFQLLRGETADDAAGTDWDREKEWRHLGDLDLNELSTDDALVFVPTAAEAEVVTAFSPWPVTVLSASAE